MDYLKIKTRHCGSYKMAQSGHQNIGIKRREKRSQIWSAEGEGG